jgi:hypothetical protein
MEGKACPECGCKMVFIHGCGFDYDRWVCYYVDGLLRMCTGYVGLETTTFPEGVVDS